MTEERKNRGVLGGSRLLEQPEHQALVRRWQAALAGSGPVLVEVGFDHGRRLQATAAENPDWTILGIEVRKKRVLEILERAEHLGLSNLDAFRVDARVLLSAATPDASVDIVEVLFPDPWWNLKHRQTRRLIQAPFVTEVTRVLKPGGLLHIATDVLPYGVHIESVLQAADGLTPISAVDGAAQRPLCAQLSRREWRSERDELPIARLYARRNP